ncbi:MAG: type II toxin-antitoxin system RelE/ParE family toxin [Bacteroidales bacterium]|nr:type II toxin-antitoxin system RelE/ParE family toxin [Bacteroidales bacterium]
MKLVWSDRFKEKIRDYFDYCLVNYGKTSASKKQSKLDNILNGLLQFPESYRIEPLLQGKSKEYRAINFEKDFKIIYSIAEDEIRLENLWNTKRNPKSLKKDI